MHLVVVGASGRLGRRVVEYALEAGHTVVAYSRSAPEAFRGGAGLRTVGADVRDAAQLHAALAGAHAVVSCLGAPAPYHLLWQGMETLVAQALAQGVPRVIAVGGAGILQATPDRLRSELDTFPDFLRPVSQAHYQAWKVLEASGLDWTMVCPPGMPSRSRTGSYWLAPDAYPKGGSGEVAVEDVADFILAELANPHFSRRRVGICYPPKAQ